jgi:hypothetical protein
VFENVSNDEIAVAVDEMVEGLGVREDIPSGELLGLLKKGDTRGCVQEIAARLGLPIRISLSYVSSDFTPGDTHGFRSSELSRTDSSGHGVDGITAQVTIPKILPLYGSPSLEGYVISVRVGENCAEHPQTFVAVMAHELSHVLLGSLWHPQRDSELHTDLVPILLGFRDVVREGRKFVKSRTAGNRTTTETTTYGYLTDSQFELACRKVSGILQLNKLNKDSLLALVAQMRKKIEIIERGLATFRAHVLHLDTRLTKKMREDDARRVVKFHEWNYTARWESAIKEARVALATAESFAQPLSHYTRNATAQIKEHTRHLERELSSLDRMGDSIQDDVKVLNRNVGIVHRIRWMTHG